LKKGKKEFSRKIAGGNRVNPAARDACFPAGLLAF